MMSSLFSEYIIKGKTIKNRVVMPPMVCFGWTDHTGFVTENHLKHYESRAKGGAGIIILEALCVTPEARLTDSQLGIWSDEHIEGLKQIVDTCHKYGTVVMAQIHHAGLKAANTVSNDITAPSDYMDKDIAARALTTEEIMNIRNSFINAAIRAEKAGLDGIELHGAHGYLLSQFASPLINHRKDEYGGSLSGRMKLSCEIIRGIKEATIHNFIIGYRMGGNEPELDDGIKIAQILEGAGVDILHVSAGIAGDKIPSAKKDYPFNWIVYCGTEIKKKVNIPVIVVNGIRIPEQAEFILDNKLADFVAVGRGMLSDPEWPNKAYQKQPINPCKNCKRCLWFKDGRLCPALLYGHAMQDAFQAYP
jgi:NADPH2 dehydrogenase